MSWLDRIPLIVLLIVAVPLIVAPYPLHSTPHLVEKFQMLTAGYLTQWVDIGDVVLHGLPATLLIAKLARMATQKFAFTRA